MNGYHIVLVNIKETIILCCHKDALKFDSPNLSYFNELGLYFKKIKDWFPIGSMLYLFVTLLEKFQMVTNKCRNVKNNAGFCS